MIPKEAKKEYLSILKSMITELELISRDFKYDGTSESNAICSISSKVASICIILSVMIEIIAED